MASATSGKPVAAGWGTAVCLLGILLGTLGCGAGGRPGARASQPADTPPPSASAAAPDFCKVELPASWQQALTAGRISHQPGEAMSADAIATDGGGLFADSYLSGVRQLVWLRDRGTTRTVVLRFAKADHQVLGAAYDGRWLVFAVVEGPLLSSPWTMYAWDSATGGTPRALVHSTVPAPYPHPVLYRGVAYWTEPVSAQRTELHMSDLSTGTDRVIREGTPYAPFLFGSLLVWTETSGDDGAPIQVHVADAATGQPAALPRELGTPLRRPAFVNADADRVVWAARTPTGLWVWRRGAAAPVTILSRTASGQNLQWPQVAGDLVAWDNGVAQFVADLRTGSYAQLTQHGGSTMLAADALLVGYPPAEKGAHPVAEASIVRPSTLPPLPRCG
jgi:hypothetical protein